MRYSGKAQADRLRDRERVAKAEIVQEAETSSGSHLPAFVHAVCSAAHVLFGGGVEVEGRIMLSCLLRLNLAQGRRKFTLHWEVFCTI